VNGVSEISTYWQPFRYGTARPSKVAQLPSPSERNRNSQKSATLSKAQATA
jgi:hypothetical protein